MVRSYHSNMAYLQYCRCVRVIGRIASHARNALTQFKFDLEILREMSTSLIAAAVVTQLLPLEALGNR